MMSRGLRTLCNGPETPTQWKFESVTDGLTDSPRQEMLSHLKIFPFGRGSFSLNTAVHQRNRNILKTTKIYFLQVLEKIHGGFRFPVDPAVDSF